MRHWTAQGQSMPFHFSVGMKVRKIKSTRAADGRRKMRREGKKEVEVSGSSTVESEWMGWWNG